MPFCQVFGPRFLFVVAEATTPVEESAHNQLSKLASITLDVARLRSICSSLGETLPVKKAPENDEMEYEELSEIGASWAYFQGPMLVSGIVGVCFFLGVG